MLANPSRGMYCPRYVQVSTNRDGIDECVPISLKYTNTLSTLCYGTCIVVVICSNAGRHLLVKSAHAGSGRIVVVLSTRRADLVSRSAEVVGGGN
jgi:hypothetical protein